MSGGGFPVLSAVALVIVQAAFGVVPDKKPTPAPVAAPVAVAALPAPSPVNAAPVEVFVMLPDVVPLPKPRPKAASKPANVRKHKPAQMIRRAPPAPPAPAPVQWSVSIRLSL